MNLGWVDFSSEDREKVLDVMNLLQEKGAVDEIGIGLVRDAFANLLFPGTSTVQTIAKYFLIVPYVLKEAVDGKYGNDISRILKRIDQEEKNCGIRLMQNCPGEDGIIGRRVLPNNWVARKPSNIYWNGIRTYGICTQDLTIPELLKASIVLQKQKGLTLLGNKGDDSTNTETDDTDAGRDVAMQMFSVPDDYYTDWRSNLSIKLTASEAAFLRKNIEENVGSSLLGHLLRNNIDVNRYDSFESIYEELGQSVPLDIKRSMELACDFNRLVYVARVRYNYILSSGENEEAIDRWKEIEATLHHMISVDIDEVLGTLKITNFRLRRFLTRFRDALISGNLEEADNALIDREIEIKTRSRAKLCKKDDFKNEGWIGGLYLDYRFGSAKRIILDIYSGEDAAHV